MQENVSKWDERLLTEGFTVVEDYLPLSFNSIMENDQPPPNQPIENDQPPSDQPVDSFTKEDEHRLVENFKYSQLEIFDLLEERAKRKENLFSCISSSQCNLKIPANLDTQFERDTLLTLAARYGKVLLVRELIRQGVNVDLPGENEWTALHFAAGNGHLKIVKILLKNKANFHWDIYNNTALYYAAQNNHLEIVKCLLFYLDDREKSDVINETNIDGDTALACAIRMGNIEVARYLNEIRHNFAKIPETNTNNSLDNYPGDYLDDYCYADDYSDDYPMSCENWNFNFWSDEPTVQQASNFDCDIQMGNVNQL